MRALLAKCAGVVLVALCAYAAPAHAQTGRITGIVTDQQTGQPLVGVQIFLEGTGRGTLTQESGRYFLINVPPGNYTLVAQLIGYATIRREGVNVAIDIARTVDFQLPSQAVAVQEIIVEAERVPLIQVNATGSTSTLTGEAIQALPVSDLRGALALQPGFLDLQLDNEDAVSYVDSRRGITPARVRGGRHGEMSTLVDGIPVNNIIFGGPAFAVPPFAVQQVDFVRGGFEAQYGNALSGITNIVTRPGSPTLRGSMRYSSSRLGGAMGLRQDELLGDDTFDGYLSGPVPGTDTRLRYVLAGQYRDRASRVLEYDSHTFDPNRTTRDPLGGRAHQLDVISGWRAFGFTQTTDLYGKLTYAVTPAAMLNVGYMSTGARTQGFDGMHQFIGLDLETPCIENNPDVAGWCERYFGSRQYNRLEDVFTGGQGPFPYLPYGVRNSVSTDRSLMWAKWDHTMGRFAYTGVLGRYTSERLSCNWFGGVCLEGQIRHLTTIGPLAVTQFTAHSRHGAPWTGPAAAMENFFGQDSTSTMVARADVQGQVTDHHNLSAGLFFQRHELYMNETRNTDWPFDRPHLFARYDYQANPWDAAIYFQDRIEYDFLTVRLGFRFDYGRADGLFFSDPMDPTHGTTAFEVCEGRAPSLGQTTPWTVMGEDGQPLPFTGIAACSMSPALMDSARMIAFQDDFSKAPVRRQFSPRLGLNFPVTETAAFFANYGQYSQIPTYHAMFQRTGIGRLHLDSLPLLVLRETGSGVVVDTILQGQSLEGTTRGPDMRLFQGQPSLIGNPRLENERTSIYEIGFLTELFNNYGLSVTAYYKDQSGLTGIRTGGVRPTGERINDPGETYGSTSPRYRILVNSDYQTSRGFEATLRRRVVNNWGFDVNYGYMQAFTNAAPPELQLQRLYEADQEAFLEVRSEVDQPHTLNTTIRLEAGAQAPDVPLGHLLRHTRIAVTNSFASGLPYTPTTSFISSARQDRNSGRAPAILNTNLQLSKDFQIANLRYGGVLRVNNVFDRKNCQSVYSTTGRCDAGALAGNRFFPSAGAGVAPAFPETNYLSTTWDRPQMLYPRRHVSAGLQVSF
jgi:outer membrane receptor protein involved in Fe transport